MQLRCGATWRSITLACRAIMTEVEVVEVEVEVQVEVVVEVEQQEEMAI
jgi:hypothetical protein